MRGRRGAGQGARAAQRHAGVSAADGAQRRSIARKTRRQITGSMPGRVRATPGVPRPSNNAPPHELPQQGRQHPSRRSRHSSKPRASMSVLLQ